MGLALGSSIISNNHEYGYKENVNAELALAKAYTNSCEAFSNSCSNAETNALQSMNSAKSSEDNAKASEANALQSMISAKESAASVKVWKTNCITEIPQDIKLELNNGTLTLKAGSKVYVPNGFESDGVTEKFDAITIESDVNGDTGSAEFLYFYKPSTNGFGATDKGACYSGTSAPSGPKNLDFWYDLTNNKVKRFLNNNWVEGFTLPICISHNSHIDQIFNGYGYIGSTVYTLPGVKGLISNGRDDERHPLNIETVTKKVSMISITPEWGRGIEQMFLTTNDTMDLHRAWKNYNISSITPTNLISHEYWFNSDDNKLYATEDSGNTWNQIFGCCSCKIWFDNAKITDLKINQPFRALDYSDKAEIGTWGMPCGKYQEITLGASTAEYESSGNGWMLFMKQATDVNQWIYMGYNNSTMEACGIAGASGWCRIFFPVKKGDRFKVAYTANGADSYCRLIYAEGENV